MKDEIRELVERAYKFGYFIGYEGHSEWTEWVRKRREELYKMAEAIDAYEVVKQAYNKGKADGMKKREEDILKGLGKGSQEGEKPQPPKIEPVGEGAEEAIHEDGEAEFTRFLETTHILLPPDFLDSLKHLKPPKMLRMGR